MAQCIGEMCLKSTQQWYSNPTPPEKHVSIGGCMPKPSCRLLILGFNLSSALKKPSKSPKSLTCLENIGLNALQVLYIVKKSINKAL